MSPWTLKNDTTQFCCEMKGCVPEEGGVMLQSN